MVIDKVIIIQKIYKNIKKKFYTIEKAKKKERSQENGASVSHKSH
jgi:hypothetical protein